MAKDGISVTPSSDVTVVIADTTVSNNNSDGIFATASSGLLRITLSHVKVINNGFTSSGFGVRLTGLAASFMFATIDSTLIAENGRGLDFEASSPGLVTAFIINSNFVNNFNSMTVGASTSITIEKTSVAPSLSGITNFGTIISFSDNAILDFVTGNAIQPISLQ